MPNHFADRICKSVKSKRTPLIVGLDPVYDRLPRSIISHKSTSRAENNELDAAAAVDAIFDFCLQTMRIAAPLVPAVKINIACFEKYLWEGIETYYALISEAQELNLEVIGDVKRGDIGHTAELYAEAHLENSELSGLNDSVTPDAVTINGFAGSEGIEPFAKVADKNGKGVFAWVRASNPSASVISDFENATGQKLYEKLADIVAEIANRPEHIGSRGYSNIGMVVAGTPADVTAALRKKYDKILFLVPGYGSQGIAASECVRFCKSDGTGALINASRSIIYAYENPKYKEQFGDDWKRSVEQAVIDAKVDLANAMQAK